MFSDKSEFYDLDSNTKFIIMKHLDKNNVCCFHQSMTIIFHLYQETYSHTRSHHP